MAIAVSLEHFSEVHNNPKAKILAVSLDIAIEKLLKEGKSPKRKVGEIDNRGSHFYLAMYWAEELAKQSNDTQLQHIFGSVSSSLIENKEKIIDELNSAQGRKEDIKGYYLPDTSTTFGLSLIHI